MARPASSQAEIQALRGMRAPPSMSASSSNGSSSSVQENAADSPMRRVQLSSTTEATQEQHPEVAAPSSDPSLPAGWQKIIHDSGLPCYVHEKLRLVCWSKPYVLDLMCSPSEFAKVAQQHVPPLSLFKTPDMKAKENKTSSGGPSSSSSSSQESAERSFSNHSNSKKRKLKNTAEQERPQKTQDAPKTQENQLSMSIEEFKTLPIGDARVLQVKPVTSHREKANVSASGGSLNHSYTMGICFALFWQACMELSVKTPAQVLQEYQNRNRGISINYNTIPVDRDGVKLFKTIVTAGSTAAEGVATTKKTAKQLGAQSLLAMLHERTVKTYQEVADLYSSMAKGQSMAIESSSSSSLVAAPPVNATSSRDDSYRRPVDPRANRLAPAARNGKKLRRAAPGTGGYNGGGGGYADYSEDAVGDYPHASAAGGSSYPRYGDPQSQWGGYHQPYYHPGSGAWQAGAETDPYNAEQHTERERIVEYSQATASPSGYGGGQYYSEDPWGYNRSSGGAPPQYAPTTHGYPAASAPNGSLNQYGPLPQQGDHRYLYRSQGSDRPGSTHNRLKINLRNRMHGGM